VVCFIEDVTQIVRVERMEAWREVARRIAHEIKNPLTPIQLAAQRLHKRFAPQISEGAEVFEECTQTIGQAVTELKELVNEFSTFARLPAVEHTPQDLNTLVQEAVVLFREAHRDIDFAFVPGSGLPPLEVDREGMKRVLVNLLDNAVTACRMGGRMAGDNSSDPSTKLRAGLAQDRPFDPSTKLRAGLAQDQGQGRIEIVTCYLHPQGIVRLEVADNGCGIAPEVKARIFEPYFSTKREGTGLGLAIVASIVADHQAFVRVRDNPPRGSRFIIELPVRRSARLFGLRADLSEASDNGSDSVNSVNSIERKRRNGRGTR
jgi:two-component system nitrogen regulation sensor histidine kinase NtrY